jgi:hypothetical protein
MHTICTSRTSSTCAASSASSPCDRPEVTLPCRPADAAIAPQPPKQTSLYVRLQMQGSGNVTTPPVSCAAADSAAMRNARRSCRRFRRHCSKTEILPEMCIQRSMCTVEHEVTQWQGDAAADTSEVLRGQTQMPYSVDEYVLHEARDTVHMLLAEEQRRTSHFAPPRWQYQVYPWHCEDGHAPALNSIKHYRQGRPWLLQ